MYLIIKERGAEGFNGYMGSVEFKNGRSIEPVSRMEAERLASIMRIETDEGVNPSGSQRMLDSRNERAGVDQSTRKISEEEKAERILKAEEKAAQEEAAKKAETEPMTTIGHDEESLIAIADKKGISGLRAIAEPLGITDRSIQGLIKEMMEYKAKAEAHNAALSE